MPKSSKVTRVREETITKAQEFAEHATGKKMTGPEALDLCVDSLSEGVLDRVLDNVAEQARAWATARVRDRDAIWSALLLQFAARETDATWKITTAEGRPWLHRDGSAPSTGEALGAVELEELVAEIRAGGATDETPELN